jgi:phosphoglycerate dehydrogenase-like enzyme
MRWVSSQRDHKWERFTHGELNGLTCGIIGLGHSAVYLALKAKAFHMHVIGMRRKQMPASDVDEPHGRDGLHEFLARSDVVVVTAPLTRETARMLGEESFGL